MGKRQMALALAVTALTALVAMAATPAGRRLARARKALEQLKLVDGAGSELDADLLQGQPAAAFAGSDHVHANLDDRTRCMRVVGDVGIFDGCN